MKTCLNYFNRTSVLVIVVIFFNACDPSSTTEFRIENNTNSEISLTCYGFTGISGSHDKETITKTLASGESYVLDSFERLTSTPVPYRKNTMEFFDSVKVEHKSRQVTSWKTFKRTIEWPFSEGEGTHLLTIDEGDF